jgi:hypothetical protein
VLSVTLIDPGWMRGKVPDGTENLCRIAIPASLPMNVPIRVPVEVCVTV